MPNNSFPLNCFNARAKFLRFWPRFPPKCPDASLSMYSRQSVNASSGNDVRISGRRLMRSSNAAKNDWMNCCLAVPSIA